MPTPSWVCLHVSLDPPPDEPILRILDQRMIARGFSKSFDHEGYPSLPPTMYSNPDSSANPEDDVRSIFDFVRGLNLARHVRVLALRVEVGAIMGD